jgi:hypothetical protein
LFLATDGWGTANFMIKDGIVTIRAWASEIVLSEKHVTREVHSYDATIADYHFIEFDQSFDVDKNLIVVQVSTFDKV